MNVLNDEILKNVGESFAQEIESFIIESKKEVWVDMQRCELYDQSQSSAQKTTFELKSNLQRNSKEKLYQPHFITYPTLAAG